MNALISIITPVYNSEKYLLENLTSVRVQTYIHWEHILVDDCSSDGSGALIKTLQKKDPRIKYHRLEKNSGAGIARNRAIELANGDYIAFLDSDDQWHSKKLENQLNFMNANNYHFTFTDYDIVDTDNKKLNITICSRRKVTFKRALFKNPIGCLTVIYSKKHFGKQYFPSIRKCEDYALWLKLLKKADGYGLSECLASYRKRNDSISSNKVDLLKYIWQIYRKEENLSWLKSIFYSVSTIVLKLKQSLIVSTLVHSRVLQKKLFLTFNRI